jgi:hypothetical protein
VPTANVPAVFSDGISKHIGITLRERPSMVPRIFHLHNAESKFIDEQNWENYGAPVLKMPKQAIAWGEAKQSFGKRYKWVVYALGDLISKEDWTDDKYGVLHRLIPQKGGGMARAFATNYEIQHANLFTTYGYVSGTSVAGMFDGVSLFNTAHPISMSNTGTTAANRPTTDVDLSVTSWQAAAVNLRLQKEENNYTYLDNEPSALVVNPVSNYVAKQILRGEWQPFSADRTTNPIREEGIELLQWPYFTKSGATGTNNAWFVLGKTHHLNSFMRWPYECDTDYSGYLMAYEFYCSQRFGLGASNWRGLYGSLGS